MNVGRKCVGVFVGVAAAAVGAACGNGKAAEINPIEPKLSFNRARAPLSSPLEITYTWVLEPGAKTPTQDYRALVHFLDSHGVMLFEDDHTPVPPPTQWEPGKTYTYSRTKFIPNYPYVGDVEVRMGLYPHPGRGERPALKGDHAGMREYRVGKLELLPITENIYLVHKEGWHNPEPHPDNASIERTWTKKEARLQFKNPKKDVVVYLEADTSPKFFKEPPVLTVTVGDAGLVLPIESSEVFLKKIKVGQAHLGAAEWVDLLISMNQSFVPKLLTPPLNNDDRELGLLVYHVYVGEADKLGPLTGKEVVDAAPLAPSVKPSVGKAAPVTGTAPKRTPAPAKQS